MRGRKDASAPEATTFPGYAQIAEIATSTFATVYRAVELGTGRAVALKVLRLADTSRHMVDVFKKEVGALALLSNHPNVTTLYRAFFTPEGRPVLVLELCRGSLAQRVRQEGPLPPEEVVRVGVKIAGALETAHRSGLLHRDMKPQNILVSQFGEPVLADFGVAALQAAAQTTEGVFGFTTLHAPPEALEGQPLSPAADVYGLASAMYQLLLGRGPFAAYDGEAPASVILRILRDPAPRAPASGAPIGLVDLLERALAKDPSGRPQSAGAFAESLREVETAAGWLLTPYVVWDTVPAQADLPGPGRPVALAPPGGPPPGPAAGPAPDDQAEDHVGARVSALLQAGFQLQRFEPEAPGAPSTASPVPVSGVPVPSVPVPGAAVPAPAPPPAAQAPGPVLPPPPPARTAVAPPPPSGPPPPPAQVMAAGPVDLADAAGPEPTGQTTAVFVMRGLPPPPLPPSTGHLPRPPGARAVVAPIISGRQVLAPVAEDEEMPPESLPLPPPPVRAFGPEAPPLDLSRETWEPRPPTWVARLAGRRGAHSRAGFWATPGPAVSPNDFLPPRSSSRPSRSTRRLPGRATLLVVLAIAAGWAVAALAVFHAL